MRGPASDAREGSAPALHDTGTVWVVSPHLLVAQAVSAALRAVGTSVESRAWENLVDDARTEIDPAGTRHVVAIFDGMDGVAVVEEIARLVSLGDVRVAVVTSGTAAIRWGGLVDGGAVDVIVMESVDDLAGAVQRFVAGEHLMDPQERRALRDDWAQALDRRRQLVLLVRTLSAQQLRVLELLASGRRVAEVAQLLGVADATVRSHVKALRAKLGARTQLEAVAMLRQLYELIDGPLPAPAPAPVPVPRPRGASEIEASTRR